VGHPGWHQENRKKGEDAGTSYLIEWDTDERELCDDCHTLQEDTHELMGVKICPECVAKDIAKAVAEENHDRTNHG
jgi:hypothetical protein